MVAVRKTCTAVFFFKISKKHRILTLQYYHTYYFLSYKMITISACSFTRAEVAFVTIFVVLTSLIRQTVLYHFFTRDPLFFYVSFTDLTVYYERYEMAFRSVASFLD